jgi:hypothetical protein
MYLSHGQLVGTDEFNTAEIRNPNIEIRNKSEIQMTPIKGDAMKPVGRQVAACFGHLKFGHCVLFRASNFVLRIFAFIGRCVQSVTWIIAAASKI